MDGKWNDWKSFIQKTEVSEKKSSQNAESTRSSDSSEITSRQINLGLTAEGNIFVLRLKGTSELKGPKEVKTQTSTKEQKNERGSENVNSISSVDLPSDQFLTASITIRGDQNKSYHTIPKQNHSVTWNQRFILLPEDMESFITFEMTTFYKDKHFSAGTKSIKAQELYEKSGAFELKLSSGHLNIITRRVPFAKFASLSKKISDENKERILELKSSSNTKKSQIDLFVKNCGKQESLTLTYADNIWKKHSCYKEAEKSLAPGKPFYIATIMYDKKRKICGLSFTGGENSIDSIERYFFSERNESIYIDFSYPMNDSTSVSIYLKDGDIFYGRKEETPTGPVEDDTKAVIFGSKAEMYKAMKEKKYMIPKIISLNKTHLCQVLTKHKLYPKDTGFSCSLSP